MGHQGAESDHHSWHISLAGVACRKNKQKIKVFYVYFFINVLSGTNAVSEKDVHQNAVQ